MQITISKELYSRQVLLKAAYHFTDNYYVFLDSDKERYIVEITPKLDNGTEEVSVKEFSNELIAQAARESVFQETEEIRKLILGRAFASTIIEERPKAEETEETSEDDSLFEDWYDEQQ